MTVAAHKTDGRAPGDVRGADAGHRLLPGIGDILIEAWAPTRLGCMEGAVTALLECAGERVRGRLCQLERQVGPGDDRHVLAGLLGAILEVRGSTGLPVHQVSLGALPGGGVRVLLQVGCAAGGRCTPRSVSPQWVSIGRTSAGWRCEAILER